MKYAALALWLFVSPLLAQPQTDAQVMGMTEEEHKHMHDIPQGTGPSPDGGAWVRADMDGVYVVHNAVLRGYTTNGVLLRKGGLYRVEAHKGPLIWTRPDGVQETVPNSALYPASPGPARPPT